MLLKFTKGSINILYPGIFEFFYLVPPSNIAEFFSDKQERALFIPEPEKKLLLQVR